MAALAIAGGTSRYRSKESGLRRRGATMAVVVAIHVIVIALLLSRYDAPPVDLPEARLSVFDVVSPPPAIPPSPPPTIEKPLPVAPPPGGSAGREARRPAPAPKGAEATIDSTTTVDAPPALPPSIGIGSATDLEGPGASGSAVATATGLGEGSGTGSGNGAGDGSGDGGGIAWRRADWIEQPDAIALATVYPRPALRERKGGSVTLACIIPRPGKPKSCKLIDESPRKWGFGQAAMRVWRTFRIRPISSTERDHPEIPVLVPIQFVAPALPPPR